MVGATAWFAAAARTLMKACMTLHPTSMCTRGMCCFPIASALFFLADVTLLPHRLPWTTGTVTREISFVLVEELSESGRWLQRAVCRLTREGVDSDVRLARVSQGSGVHVEGGRSTRFDWPVPVTATEQVCRRCGVG